MATSRTNQSAMHHTRISYKLPQPTAQQKKLDTEFSDSSQHSVTLCIASTSEKKFPDFQDILQDKSY